MRVLRRHRRCTFEHMCGIVGLFASRAEIEASLGAHLAAMLVQMSDRGPDSAGVAVYRDPAPDGLEQAHALLARPARTTGTALGGELGDGVRRRARAGRAREPRGLRRRRRRPTTPRRGCASSRPELRVMSAGPSRSRSTRRPACPSEFAERVRARTTSAARHALGHTRMATESRVTTEGSHPFSTGLDLCLVHNGSLSNHNRLREQLRREGIEFQTENDTEVAAGYLTWRLREGASLEQALEGCLDDLDGFYTFARRHRRRLRRAARPDRLQAGRARRDRRLGRDGLRVPRDRGAARAPTTRASGSPSRRVVYALGDGARRDERPRTDARPRSSTSRRRRCAS